MIHMKSWLPGAAVLTTLVVLQCPLPAFGSGFGIFTQGASALGQADSVVAHADGPSAVFFNPALMNNLPGTQVEIGTTLIFPYRSFKSATTGSKYSNEDTVYYPSSFYITHAFNDKFSAGFGVFNPFGLGTEWNGNWEGRYLATKSTIETYNFNPAISYRITPNLSFAVGLDVIYFDASLESKVPLDLGPFGTYPDANSKFNGNGTGFGYNLGLAYKAGSDITLGVSYRSEVDIDVKGNLNFNIPTIPSPIDAVVAGNLPNTSAKTSITLPRQLFTGIAYQPTERLTVETGFRWEDWRSYKSLNITLNQPVNGQTSITSAKNWHDTFAINVGGKYRLNDTLTLLGGYLYSWNPVPDDTFEPSLPDSNTHLFCVGTDMDFGNTTVSLSYAYQLQMDRNKSNTVAGNAQSPAFFANGAYSADMHMLGLSLKYRF